MTTTLAPPPATETTTAEGLRPYRISVDLYERMIDAGFFRGEKTVLWRGRLYQKMTKHEPLVHAQTELTGAMYRVVPDGWHIRTDQPLRLADDWMPEPDLMVLRGASRDYRGRRPLPHDLGLLVEVADSSLAADTGPMLATYAAAGIPAYWVVGIPDSRVRTFAEPEGPTYRARRDYGPGESIPVVLDGVEVGRIAAESLFL
jgi:hypothetical protein